MWNIVRNKISTRITSISCELFSLKQTQFQRAQIRCFRALQTPKSNCIQNSKTVVTNARNVYLTRAEFNATVEESLQKWCVAFKKQDISEPLESIANILASVLGTNNLGDVYKYRKTILTDGQLERMNVMCEKRLEKMPVQYIIGEWDFREINLKLQPPVFIPRPETEMLVELVLQDLHERNENAQVLELCCGSGAISLALLHNIENLQMITIDKSIEACKLCKENAERLGVSNRIEIQHCAVEDFETKKMFDVIVSNPPYVLSGEMKTLQPEILRYEDVAALDGGEDGLTVVQQIFNVAARFLNPGGRLFLEVDPTHPQLIAERLAHSRQLSYVGGHKDLSDETRFVEIIKN